MNVIPFPSYINPLQSGGQFQPDYLNFFSMNTQEQQRYFSQDGHLVPTRTTADLTALSTEQYTARIAYNGDTDNFMGNVAGIYKNFTMGMFLERLSLLTAMFDNKKIEHFWDEDNNLYSNVNGTVYQQLMIPVDHKLNITTDGTDLFINIDGNNYKFNLTPV